MAVITAVVVSKRLGDAPSKHGYYRPTDLAFTPGAQTVDRTRRRSLMIIPWSMSWSRDITPLPVAALSFPAVSLLCGRKVITDVLDLLLEVTRGGCELDRSFCRRPRDITPFQSTLC